MGVPAQSASHVAGRRLLRRRQSRGGLFERPALFHHARRPGDRDRREFRQADLAGPGRQHHEGRDDHHVAPRRRGEGDRRRFRRRVRCARLAAGARRGERQARLEGVPLRARQGRADRPRFPPLLRRRPGQGSRRPYLADRRLEDRRRHRLGLDQLRSVDEDDLLRHRQSGAVEPRAEARRQQVDDRSLRPRHRHRPGALVLPDDAARYVRP